MILPSEYSAAKFGRWERGGSIFPYFISCIPFLLFSLPHSHIFILKTMKIFLALPFLHHFLNILSHKRNGIVSNCFKINSEIFMLYSYNLSHVFFPLQDGTSPGSLLCQVHDPANPLKVLL